MTETGTNALARIEAGVAMLREARTLDEVSKIRALAVAAEAYARAEKLGDEAVGYANEIRVRAARKAGEMLAAMAEKAKGGQPYQRSTGSSEVPVDAPPTLAQIGVTKKESARFQAIAAVPEEEFEEEIRKERPTETKMAALGRKDKPVKRTPRQHLEWKAREISDKVSMALTDLVAIEDPAGCARACRSDSRHVTLAKQAADWLTAFICEITKEENAA